MTHLYRIDIELSDPLTPDQMDDLGRAVDELVLGDLPNYLRTVYRGGSEGKAHVTAEGTVSP